MALKKFPTGSNIVPIVIPVDGTRDVNAVLPDCQVVGIHYITLATTGTPTTVTATVTDKQSTALSIETAVTQTADAVTDATMPTAGMVIDDDNTRRVKCAITFDGGTTPTWKGSITLLCSIAAQ